jgi:hypothetical protein
MKLKLLVLSLFLCFGAMAQEVTSEEVIIEVATEIGNDISPVLDIIKKGEFPKDTVGWIMLIFTTLLPWVTRFAINKAKYTSLFAKIKAKNEGSKTIAFIISMVVGLVYEILQSGVEFDPVEWGAYSVLVYAGAIVVHEIIAKFKKEKKESV